MTAKNGHTAGTVSAESRVNSGRHGRAVADQASVPVVPRLLDLHGAATYLGLSAWTIRDLEHAGILPRVRVSLPNEKELRKLLFDRQDLDKAIEVWKDQKA